MAKQTTGFRISKVFGRACPLFARHFFKFVMVTGIASLSWLPFFALHLSLPALLAMLFVAVITSVLSQAVVLLGAFQGLQGRPISLSGSLRVSFRQFLPLVGLVVCLGLVLMAVGLFGSAIINPGPPGDYTGLIIVIAGIALFLVWSVAMPVCVIEGLGLFDSLSRSHDLTEGYRLKIAVLLLMTIVTSGLITRVVGFALAVGLVLVFGSAVAFWPAFSVILPLLWIAIWTAFLAVLLAVIYYGLRLAKEGIDSIDTDQIATIFD